MAMYPPFFDTVRNVAAVKSVFGNSPRIYPHGEADQNTLKPYAVFQNIGGSPENYIGDLPDCDDFTTQVDVYAHDSAQLWAGVRALRDAVEGVAYIVRWGDDRKDPDTNLRRFDFDIDWIVHR